MVGPRAALATSRVRARRTRGCTASRSVEAVKLRYGSAAVPVGCRPRGDGGIELELEQPVHGVAPGQTACLMSGDRVVGAGTIGAATMTAPRSPSASTWTRRLAGDFLAVIRLIIGGIAERVDFGFEEIDDLQLAVERLLAEAGPRGERCTSPSRSATDGIRARVGPLRERAIADALRDGDAAPGELTLPRILQTVVDSFGVEDVEQDDIVVRLEKLKATP